MQRSPPPPPPRPRASGRPPTSPSRPPALVLLRAHPGRARAPPRASSFAVGAFLRPAPFAGTGRRAGRFDSLGRGRGGQRLPTLVVSGTEACFLRETGVIPPSWDGTARRTVRSARPASRGQGSRRRSSPKTEARFLREPGGVMPPSRGRGGKADGSIRSLGCGGKGFRFWSSPEWKPASPGSSMSRPLRA